MKNQIVKKKIGNHRKIGFFFNQTHANPGLWFTIF
jgi:hypothetical protein